MPLTLYQESVPFTNKRIPQQISTNESYSNPVVMSFAFDFTVCTNVLETVIYLRNDNPNEYYRNVVITLCKEDAGMEGILPASVFGILKEDPIFGNILHIDDRFIVPFTYSVEQPAALPIAGTYITGMYTNAVIPITDYQSQELQTISTDDNIISKFSYGYDELSNIEWMQKKPALVIPSIGNINTPDTSYIPIRLRIDWKKASSLFTIRDYYIDVSYEKVQNIGVPIL